MKQKHEFLTNFLSSAFVPVIIESLFWLNSRITKTFCLNKRQRNEPRRPNKETSAKSKNVADHTMLKRSAQNDKMFWPPKKSHFFHITLTICKKITLRWVVCAADS